MTTLVECPHGDDPSLCPPCNPIRDERGTGSTGRGFEARFEGHCPVCDEPIRIGDLIVALATTDYDGYGHEDCA